MSNDGVRSIVGRSFERNDAEAKVRGVARYVDDLVFPGMLHAVVARSGYPRFRVDSIDPAPALEAGAEAVFTAADIPGKNVVPLIYEDMPFLAAEEARFHGEGIAVVVAQDRRTALDAAAALESRGVRGRELEALTDFERWSDPDVPAVTEHGEAKNLFKSFRIRRGDVERAFSEAAVVVENTYRTGYQEHAYIETQGVVAVPERGGITIYASMQCPFYVQNAVAQILGLPLGRVRAVVPAVGGGFGGKEEVPSVVAGQAALAAWLLGRPVKLILEREEDVRSMSKRHPALIQVKTACDGEGRLLATKVRYVIDSGAYAGISSVVLWRGTVHAAGPYRCPNVWVDSYAVATNRCPSGAFRGFGQPQVAFAVEAQLDELASRLGMDPLEFRLRNVLRKGDETATSQVIGEGMDPAGTLERAREASRWDDERRSCEVSQEEGAGGKRRGIGVSTIFYGVALGAMGKGLAKAGAQVQVCGDGSVQVAVGTTEMGQGTETVLCQIAAEALGARFERVSMLEVDTSRVPDSGPTVASRATTLSGNAILDACRKIRSRMDREAARLLSVSPDEVTAAEGWFRVRSAPDRRVSFDEVASVCAAARIPLVEQGYWAVEGTSFDERDGRGDAYLVYTFVTTVAKIEVDCETAEVRVLELTQAIDASPVNPVLAEGQAQGGMLQGVGYALCENLVCEGGRILTPDLSTYVIPGTMEVPRYNVEFVRTCFPSGPFGVKGIGETPLIGVAPAVANALKAATGVRATRLPLTPEYLFGLFEHGRHA